MGIDETYGGMSDFDLTGQIAIVTGGSRGIGAAISKRLARAGAHVVISSRKSEACESLAADIIEAGGSAEGRACHAGNVDATKAMIETVYKAHGRLDILVNNAAANPWFGPILKLEAAAYDKTVDVNLRGTLFASIAAANLMKAQGAGVIINTASVNGNQPVIGQGIYSITKGAVITMTKSMAKELGRYNIRVNALLPGITKTDALDDLFQGTDELPDIWRAAVPLNRHAMPAEMAGAVLFLASNSASFVTGACLTVDGGQTLQ